MVCPDCGTRLTDTDQFCPGCGAKIIRKRRCPECGETLREGVKFCPGCGSEVSGERRVKKAKPEEEPKKKAEAAPPTKRKQTPPKPRDWEDEDDDDYEDDEEESVDILSILTVAVGCILLVILAVLGYNLYRRYMPRDLRTAEEQSVQQEEDGDTGQDDGFGGQELFEEPEEDAGPEEVQTGGTLVTTADVNIRDNPSTDGTTVITKAKAGESYEYTEAVEGGMWYRILLPDEPNYEYGYVYADYVNVQ